jgi:pimeloyl-ACP methyl ester carboxylesterase
VSENIAEVIAARRYNLSIMTLHWCRYNQMVKDHMDYPGQLAGARRLADHLACLRAACPERKLYVIGHSAGTHVVLVAAGMLPPGIIDRIVLLAPSVSYCFDLRAALRCSREGIDCFFSTQDQLVSIGAEYYGTADRKMTLTAGEVGFARLPPEHPDAPLYCKLRQYPWNRSMVWTGHKGGHYGFTGARFLDAYVVPMMLCPSGSPFARGGPG